MITPIRALTIQQICERKNDLLMSDDDIKELARNARNKAIDECHMKAKTMMEELAYQSQGRRNGKTHRLYCMQALEFLRQVAKELKGGE